MEEKNTNKKAYTFSDVLIVPKYSEIESRRNVDTSSDFIKFKLGLPIISANMKGLTGPKMAISMWENFNAMGILHRFNSVEQAVQDFLQVKNHFENEVSECESYSVGNSNAYFQVKNKVTETSSGCNISSIAKPIFKRDYVVGVSIGVQDPDDRLRYDRLYEAGARIFCIDIAHGHCKLMKEMVSWIKSKNLKDICIIGGNIATPEAAYDLANWGVDVEKCGIGPGKMCHTRRNTGCGVPSLHALETIHNELQNYKLDHIKLICDGGMETTGDVVKALKYSDACMLGYMLAGSTESEAPVLSGENGFFKLYAGSASSENKISSLPNGGANEYVEGIAKTVIFKGHIKHILKQIREGIQSAFSYTNSKNLQEFKQNCEFVEITSGGKSESKI